jgi:hypothetical protein
MNAEDERILETYRDPDRISDPTDGFVYRLVRSLPGFSVVQWDQLTDAGRRSLSYELLGIPPRTKRNKESGEEVSR